MNKNDKENIYEQKFIRNRKKRKSHDSSKVNVPKNNHITAIIVSSVLCSIFFIFTALLLFVPSFRALAIDHVLMSISSGGDHKDITNAGNSISDGIKQTITNEKGEEGNLSQDIFTFLATATDHSENLTDVIMIAKFDSASNKADIIQIPRDTYVKLSGYLIIDDQGNISPENFGSSGYETKINSVYSTGKNLGRTPINNLLNAAKGKSAAEIAGLCKNVEYSYLGISPKMVSKYLEETDDRVKKEIQETMYKSFGIRYLSTFIYYSYGIPIDYYAQVNLNGFKNIVDAIGGVDLYVPQNMYHNDPTQNLYINLKQGYQHLDGDKAEQFVRFRSYTFGDIDRLDAQKSFISAFLSKLSQSSISQIQQIATEVLENLYTNLTLSETANFARQILSMDLSGGFTMTTLPGSPVDVTRNGVWISYYSASKPAVMELVNKNFNKYNITLPEEKFGLISLSNADPVFGTPVVGTENNSNTSSKAPVSENTAPVVSQQPQTKPQQPDAESVQPQAPSQNTESDESKATTDVTETTTPEDNENPGDNVSDDKIEEQIPDDSILNTENDDSDASDVHEELPSDIPLDSDSEVENALDSNTDEETEPETSPDLENVSQSTEVPVQEENSSTDIDDAPAVSDSEATEIPEDVNNYDEDLHTEAEPENEAEPIIFSDEMTAAAA